MTLDSLPLFGAIAKRMGWLTERQRLIAENVANADTPGYAARDVRAPDFGALLRRAANPASPTVTQAAHLTAAAPGTSGGRIEVERRVEAEPNGNAVSLEAEMAKAADTALDYQLTTNLYRKQVALFRLVLGRSGGA